MRSEPIVAYFHDGPLQGRSYALPKWVDRYMVPMPPSNYRVGQRSEGAWDHSLPAFDTGVYECDRFSARQDEALFTRITTYTYHWKGTNNMGISDNVERITGRKPHTLKHIADYDEVIIDGRTLDDLIRAADRGALAKRPAAATVWIDNRIVAREVVTEATVDIPVRQAGQPHSLLIRVSQS